MQSKSENACQHCFLKKYQYKHLSFLNRQPFSELKNAYFKCISSFHSLKMQYNTQRSKISIYIKQYLSAGRAN